MRNPEETAAIAQLQLAQETRPCTAYRGGRGAAVCALSAGSARGVGQCQPLLLAVIGIRGRAPFYRDRLTGVHRAHSRAEKQQISDALLRRGAMRAADPSAGGAAARVPMDLRSGRARGAAPQWRVNGGTRERRASPAGIAGNARTAATLDPDVRGCVRLVRLCVFVCVCARARACVCCSWCCCRRSADAACFEQTCAAWREEAAERRARRGGASMEIIASAARLARRSGGRLPV